MEYSNDLIIEADKSDLINILTDAYLVAGITGHLALLKVYDSEIKNFAPPGIAKKPVNEFLASLIIQDEKGNVKSLLGRWRGPEIFPNSISYEGISNDNKVSLKIMFNLTNLSSGIKVSIHSEFNIKLGFFERMFARYGNFASHIVKCHLIPYFSNVRSRIKQGISLTKLDSKEVDIEDAIRVLRSLPKITGIILIKNQAFSFKGYINNGQLSNMIYSDKEKSYKDSEALGKLITEKGNVKLEIYELPIPDLLRNVS
ncbi:hypothetical protein DFR86_07555 [Acidianus sulfidivorans JP7]|uniref:Uncharacterized protein n=1 Tax=Acidianus sulfidivorans JP7 TaxID=619593 RepID=A0A2U9IN09_9CREN|nr:hypothetical protein [Acidianus sulfidivorans]AWR97418.1 hypothetical protein DFR86_07555 [Acidianus sulfidivorans JP7]